MRTSVFLVMTAVCVLQVSGCAPSLGRTIEAPEIPSISVSKDARLRGRQVALQGVLDAREIDQYGQADAEVTQPSGNVPTVIENSLIQALRSQGIVVSENAPVLLSVELRKWQTEVTATTSGAIKSEATIRAQLIDPAERELYSGTYNGSTSSRAPVFTASDAQDSLGKAMAQAITQMLQDDSLMQRIASY